jgi:hypothetical protein
MVKPIMLPNAFIGHAAQPTAAELAETLGPAKPLWDRLLEDLSAELKLTLCEWNSYSRKAGWSMRLKRKERNIVYLSPHPGCFTASFALGDKAVKAARSSDVPRPVIEIIDQARSDQARRYAEGTAVRIEVRGPKDVSVVKKLTAIKLAN